MKQRKLTRWLVAILVVCCAASMTLAACKPDTGNPTDATYYLSVDGATYSSASDVPAGVKFVKGDDSYTLTVELEQGKVLTVNKVGSTDKIGYDSIFSSRSELTQGSNNTILVGAAGTYSLTLDPSEPQITYGYTAPVVGGGGTAVTAVKLNKHELVLALEGSEQLIATVEPATAINKNLLWDSSNKSVATVDQQGNVAAVSSGTTTITVTSQENGNFNDECVVTVRQGVTSISLSSTALTVYTGDGAGTRELEVTVSPENASNKDYSITLEHDGEYVKAEKAGLTITLTGLKVGSETLTVISADDPTVKATCTVTVKDIADAVPALSKDNVKLGIAGQDTVNILLDNGDITDFTVTSNAESVATVDKSESDNSFTVTGVAFGSATVTVVVTYGDSKTETLTLKVLVASDYYYLAGSINEWSNVLDESTAGTTNVLLAYNNNGTYSLTRDFNGGDKFYIVPRGGWDSGAITSSSYKVSSSNGSAFTYGTDGNNKIINKSGNYTITLDLTGSTPSWTIVGNWLAPSEVSVESDLTMLKYNSDDDTAHLTLTIGPAGTKTEGEGVTIKWEADSHKDLLSLTPNGAACTVKLSSFTGTEKLTVKIVVTVTVGTFNLTTNVTLTLAPEGASDQEVTAVIWDTENVKVDINSGAETQEGVAGWSYQLAAHTNGDDQSLTFELVADAQGTAWTEIYINGGTTAAFSIDSTGKVTAKMFGTVWVKATASNGVYNITSVTFYASNFYLDINWANPNATTDRSTKVENEMKFTWSEVELGAGCTLVILYEGVGSDWTSVITSVDYLDRTNSSEYADGDDSSLTVTQSGAYNITLDLSGLKPSIKIEWVRAVDPTVKVEIISNNEGDYTTVFASGSAKIGPLGQNYTIEFSHTFNEDYITSWTGSGWIGFAIVVDGKWNTSLTSFTCNVSSYVYLGKNDSKMSFAKSVISGKTFKFVCTFNESGAMTDVAITIS